MDREKLIELISAHLDNELESEEKVELERVLEESEEARKLLASFQAQRDGLAELPELEAPIFLKDSVKKTLAEKPDPSRQKGKSSSWIWIAGSLAACLLFFFAGDYLEPAAADQRFYLSDRGLVLSPLIEPQTIELSPQKGNSLALTSTPFQGRIGAGLAKVSWTADAGVFEGAAVRARLSLDLDGDSEFDIVQESDFVALDSENGYQEINATFVFDESDVAADGPFQAKLELLAEDDDVEGVKLRFQPEHSHLIIPVAGFKSV